MKAMIDDDVIEGLGMAATEVIQDGKLHYTNV